MAPKSDESEFSKSPFSHKMAEAMMGYTGIYRYLPWYPLPCETNATWQRKILQAAGESQFTEDMSDAVSEADFSKVKHLGGAWRPWILPRENGES